MAISIDTDKLVKNLLTTLRNTGTIPNNDYEELMVAVSARNAKQSTSVRAPELVTRASAARLLKISARSLDRMLKEGDIRAVKIGKRSVRINEAQLHDFINSRTRNEEENL